MKEKEQWRDIPGFIGLYQASDAGNIRSLARATTKGRVLKQRINESNGYCYVSLSKNNTKYSKRVHVLVMSAFCPVEKENGYDKEFTINHINGIKSDNRLNNLEWCTQSENQLKAYVLGINGKASTPVIDLDSLKVYDSLTDAAKAVGGNTGEMVARVCRGQRSHYRGRHFAFLEDFQNMTIPEYKGKVKRRCSYTLWR